jgi:predicted phage terminase large subunit-like protein
MWSITSVKKELAEGYKELVVSLGIKCSILEDTATLYGKDCGQCWTVFFFMKNASSVKYKNDNSKCGEIRPNHYIDIEEFGVGDTVCIEVDHPSHLYLAGKGMIPTHNSTFGSICLPAFYLGNHPNQKVIQGSAVDERATEFGRQVKEIIDGDMYKRIFPGTFLTKDSKSKGRFATNAGGTYYAVGATSSVQGIGADLFILDDIVGEKEAASGDIAAFDKAWEWYLRGPMQRIQPGGRILHIATRWSKADPIGKVKALAKSDKKADQFLSVEFPALNENEESTFPELWTTEMLRSKRHQFFVTGRMDLWSAQYQQSPTLMEGSIIPSSKWKRWDKNEPVNGSEDEVDFIPPDCKYTIMSLDTSYTTSKRADPSAMVLMGIFEYDDKEKKEKYNAVILLHCLEVKLEFPELKRKIRDWQKEFDPDCTLIESKGSGEMLIQEMRRSGLSVTPAKVKGIEDKITRLNSVADLVHSGLVFYIPTQQNERLVQQVNDVPAVEHDDLCDAFVHAMRHIRKGGSIELPMDYKMKDVDEYMPPENGYY